MEIVISNSADELNLKGAEYFERLLLTKPDAVLGLATGSTPIGLYNELIKKYKAGKMELSTDVYEGSLKAIYRAIRISCVKTFFLT